MPDRDRGSATVETVASIATLALFCALVLQVILLVDAVLVAGHATREGVRAAALGAGPTRVRSIVASVAGIHPRDADVVVDPIDRAPGELVTVTLRTQVARMPVLSGFLPELAIRASATARTEVHPQE